MVLDGLLDVAYLDAIFAIESQQSGLGHHYDAAPLRQDLGDADNEASELLKLNELPVNTALKFLDSIVKVQHTR